jgi:hypothetical protein
MIGILQHIGHDVARFVGNGIQQNVIGPKSDAAQTGQSYGQKHAIALSGNIFHGKALMV